MLKPIHPSIALLVPGLLIGTLLAANPEIAPADQPAKAEAASTEAESAASAVDAKRAILGTWTNPDYDVAGRSGRVVYTQGEGDQIRYIAADRADGSGKTYPGTVVFHKQWTDDNGCLCGTSTVSLDQGPKWETLHRISTDGKTLEVQSGVAKINPKGPRYSIYHKQD